MAALRDVHISRYSCSNASSSLGSPKLDGSPFSLRKLGRKHSVPVRGATSPSYNSPLSTEIHVRTKTSIGSESEYKEPVGRRRSFSPTFVESARSYESVHKNTGRRDNRLSSKENTSPGEESLKNFEARYMFRFGENINPEKIDEVESGYASPELETTNNYYKEEDNEEQFEKFNKPVFDSRGVFSGYLNGVDVTMEDDCNETSYAVIPRQRTSSETRSFTLPSSALIQNELNYWTAKSKEDRKQHSEAEVSPTSAASKEHSEPDNYPIWAVSKEHSESDNSPTWPASKEPSESDVSPTWRASEEHSESDNSPTWAVSKEHSEPDVHPTWGPNGIMLQFRSLIIITGHAKFLPDKTPHSFPVGSNLRVEFRDALQPEQVHGKALVDASYYRSGSKLGYTIICRKPSFPGAYSMWGVLNVGWTPSRDEWLRSGDYVTKNEHLVTIDEQGSYVMDLSLVPVSPVNRRRKASDF